MRGVVTAPCDPAGAAPVLCSSVACTGWGRWEADQGTGPQPGGGARLHLHFPATLGALLHLRTETRAQEASGEQGAPEHPVSNVCPGLGLRTTGLETLRPLGPISSTDMSLCFGN